MFPLATALELSGTFFAGVGVFAGVGGIVFYATVFAFSGTFFVDFGSAFATTFPPLTGVGALETTATVLTSTFLFSSYFLYSCYFYFRAFLLSS